jgi:serine protease
MNKKWIAFLSLLLIWITSPTHLYARWSPYPESADIQTYSEIQHAPPAEDNGELVVDFQNDESESFISSMLGKLGLTQSDYSFVSKEEKWVRIRKTATYLLGLLKDKEGVEAVEPNYYYSALFVPNDPYYKNQWHLDLIGMQKAWDFPPGASVTVAVIDTGVAFEDYQGKFRVEDLGQSQFVAPYNVVEGNEHAGDDHGHGTHVAGTIAQLTNNGIGTAGVGQRIKIMPVKVLNRSGYGTLSDVAAGIRYAADHGAQVINMSLGGPFPSFILHKAVKYAHEKGVVIVCAAGNSGHRGISYPGAYPECISVSAVRFDKSLSWYSSYGKGLTIAAPGGDMNVDQNGDGLMDGVLQNTLNPQDTSKQGYFLFQGTSMATPHVAAAAALLMSHGITSPDDVQNYLTKTASPAAESSADKYGAGVVNAYSALNAAVSRRKYKTLIFGIILFLILATVLNKGRSKIDRVPFSFSSLLGLLLGSTGLFFLSRIPFAGKSYFVTHSAAEWILPIGGASVYSNALLWSCLPALALVLIAYLWKKFVPLAAGFACGFACFLAANIFMPVVDVSWIPGHLMDIAWLGINSIICLMLVAIASFRLR